jgi:DNA topoisomerase II
MSKKQQVQTPLKQDSVSINKKRIKLFLDNEVKDYARYVIETRAMPSIMDGLRVGARKIIWATINGDLGKTSKVKMPSLIGDTMKNQYQHGDASLVNTIFQLGSKHIFKYHPLNVIGQIGTLRVPKSDTAARYLNVKKNDSIMLFKYDLELIKLLVDDGVVVEPKFFLPIIPIQLMYRTNSPGYGFSYRCFSYEFDSIIDNCIMSITKGSCYNDIDEIQLIPTVEGIKKENMIYNANKNVWYNVGEYQLNFDNDTVVITDLPYNITSEFYEEHLHNLVEKGYILKFINLSMDGKLKYIIQFAHGRLKLFNNEPWKLFGNLKLYSKIIKDTLNSIDIDSKTILFFETTYQLIDCFVRKRLIFYNDRKVKTIQYLKEKITTIDNKIKFINLVVNDKLIINKRPIIDIKKDLDIYLLPYDVLKINIDKLTQDEIIKMNNEKSDLLNQLDYIEKTSIQEMYVRDLIDLKETLSTINKVKV